MSVIDHTSKNQQQPYVNDCITECAECTRTTNVEKAPYTCAQGVQSAEVITSAVRTWYYWLRVLPHGSLFITDFTVCVLLIIYVQESNPPGYYKKVLNIHVGVIYIYIFTSYRYHVFLTP